MRKKAPAKKSPAPTTAVHAATEILPLKDYAEKAYLDYSMYVILDRALPGIGDGLKPVQRRIIYAMSELSLSAGAKYKKSARTVGDVIGKFHPHGDAAAYEAMVLMAQPFAYRYPLIDGQGNWGSPDDPKSFAAMRYTESRLAAYSETLLSELAQGTVDWSANFDGTLLEPSVLPARLPNLLLNGTTGIAVGMATDVPPHNMREVVAACIHLLDNPRAGLEDLLVHLPGPDYPGGAEITTPANELLDIYRTGRGTLKMRATYEVENGEIVIDQLPGQVSGGRVLEQIAAQMQAKKLPMLVDLRDEGDHENPIRLVLVPRSNRVDIEGLMGHLFATTDLQRTHRVNLNLIGLDGRPRVMNLVELLGEWLKFRTDTVRRRLEHRLDRVLDRLHVLEGLLVAFLNIDEVIRLIRTAEVPRQALMDSFGLSLVQAEAILELRLRQLAKLEEIKIRAEQDELQQERGTLEKILQSKARMKTLVKTELTQDVENYGDDRRTILVERNEARAYSETELLAVEPITLVLSQAGWVRAARGHDIDAEALSYKAGDGYRHQARGRSNQMAVFLDSTGRAYSLPAHDLPSARGQGEPLTGRLSPPAGAVFVGVMIGAGDDRVLLSSDAGYGFIARLGDLVTKNRSGKAVINPGRGKVLPPSPVMDPAGDCIAAAGSVGRLLVFPASELPELSRGKGNKIIDIPAKKYTESAERMVQALGLAQGQTLTVQAGKRSHHVKGKALDRYRGGRGLRGGLLPKGLRNVRILTIRDDDRRVQADPEEEPMVADADGQGRLFSNPQPK